MCRRTSGQPRVRRADAILPYQKATYSRFQARGFEILGMNNDPDPPMIKDSLKKASITWPQATMSRIQEVGIRYRIHLFPTSVLIAPEGQVLLLDQDKMRDADLL